MYMPTYNIGHTPIYIYILLGDEVGEGEREREEKGVVTIVACKCFLLPPMFPQQHGGVW